MALCIFWTSRGYRRRPFHPPPPPRYDVRVFVVMLLSRRGVSNPTAVDLLQIYYNVYTMKDDR